METTHLKQANANISVVGILADKSLEVKTDAKGTHIEGNVVIKTSDTNQVTIGVYCGKMTKEGKENKAYPGIETVMNEYKTIADDGAENADIIYIKNGQLNLFRDPKTGRDRITYRSNFFNRIKNNKEGVKFEASFEVECFIKSFVPETTTDGEETGRLKIMGWVPTYNGIELIEMIVPQESVSAVEATYEPGQTVEFYGDIVNNRITTVTEKPVAFGKPKKEVKTTYVNELIINGGSDPYDGDEESDPKHVPYDSEVIRKAVQERENKIEEQKNNPKVNTGARGAARPSGAAQGRKLTW